ncbi:hypothetical protein BD769DRAFT_1470865 [Suillus cothurnatus]|nr:hypothetical protein BD769DRAFT_1470865 [Suillus cothurnatus]
MVMSGIFLPLFNARVMCAQLPVLAIRNRSALYVSEIIVTIRLTLFSKYWTPQTVSAKGTNLFYELIRVARSDRVCKM